MYQFFNHVDGVLLLLNKRLMTNNVEAFVPAFWVIIDV